MILQYDPVAEDFLLIDQGRIVERIFIASDMSDCENYTLDAYNLLMKLRRPVRKTDAERPALDKPKPIEYDETLVRRFKSNGKVELGDLDIDLDDLDIELT